MVRARWLAWVLIGGLLVGTACSRGKKEEQREEKGAAEYVPGQMLVKFKVGVSSTQIDSLNELHGVTIIRKLERLDVLLLKIPEDRTVPQMVEVYQKNPNVEYAEPNAVVRIPPIETKGEKLDKDK